MSTSEAWVQVAPSYGLYQPPDVGAQSEPVTTFVPSRWSTTSRLLQLPPWSIQCGNWSRPVRLPSAATVRAASSVRAVDSDGIPGGVAAAVPARPATMTVERARTVSELRTADCGKTGHCCRLREALRDLATVTH